MSQPEFTGARGYRRVNETFVFEDKEIFEIAYRDGQGRTERVLATPNWHDLEVYLLKPNGTVLGRTMEDMQ